MRKFILIMLLLLTLAACSNDGDSNEETSESNNSQQVESVTNSDGSEAPRLEEAPAPTPTATLPPVVPIATPTNPDHVFAVTTRSVHIVESGDTMTEIANQYRVSVKSLADANRIYNFDLIQVGDKLYIPPCDIDDGLSTLQDGDR